MLTAWRLVKTAYAKTAFTGEGSFQFARRWNPPGIRMVYTAETASLAVMEVLVHLARSELPSAHTIFRVTIPESLITTLDRRALPTDWDADPPSSTPQTIGKRWIDRRVSVVLRVPSVVTRQESNFLINPAHPDFRRLTISPPEPFVFDPRSFARSR